MPAAQREARHPCRLDDRQRTPHRRSRCIERRDETIPGRVDLAAAEPTELRADDGVVGIELAAPHVIAERGRRGVVESTMSVKRTVVSTRSAEPWR